MADKEQFEILLQAAQVDTLALVQAYRLVDSRLVTLVCSIAQLGDFAKIVPLALLLDEDALAAYSMDIPPDATAVRRCPHCANTTELKFSGQRLVEFIEHIHDGKLSEEVGEVNMEWAVKPEGLCELCGCRWDTATGELLELGWS